MARLLIEKFNSLEGEMGIYNSCKKVVGKIYENRAENNWVVKCYVTLCCVVKVIQIY